MKRVNTSKLLMMWYFEQILLHTRNPKIKKTCFVFQFSMVECLLSAFADEFPVYLTKTRLRSFIYRTLVIISCFLLGLPMVCSVSLIPNLSRRFFLIMVLKIEHNLRE